jgi:hypothetical protein
MTVQPQQSGETLLAELLSFLKVAYSICGKVDVCDVMRGRNSG